MHSKFSQIICPRCKTSIKHKSFNNNLLINKISCGCNLTSYNSGTIFKDSIRFDIIDLDIRIIYHNNQYAIFINGEVFKILDKMPELDLSSEENLKCQIETLMILS